MSNTLLKISSIGAFSYAWNKGTDSNVSCAYKVISSIKAFGKAFFS